MLSKKTVFVIGAGAGVPYGFKTGGGMLDDARRLSAKHLYELTANSIAESEVNSLRDALTNTLALSVDAMLEQRTELWACGKKLLAGLLLRAEYAARVKIPTSDTDWLPLIFNMLSDEAKTIEDFSAVMARMSFITFNYDRMLEYRLRNGLKSRYGCKKDKCSSVVDSLKILHVYGSIGPQWQSAATRDGVEVVPYGPEPTNPAKVPFIQFAMANAGTTIKIIHETVDSSPEFTQARELLEGAEQVFFLGFGFGKRNVARLAILRIPQSAGVFCSAFNMKDGEIKRYIHEPFGRRVSVSTGQITDMLREFADRLA